MKISRKVEIQPTPSQHQVLLQHAGNARWAWNWGLMLKKKSWDIRKTAIENGVPKNDVPKIPTAIDLHRELNILKKKPVEEGGVPWMYSASKCSPQESLRNLDKAFQAFFRRVKAGEKPGYPKFKSRNRGVGGFSLTGAIRVEAKVITLPFLGRMRVKPGDHGYSPVRTHGQASVTERAGRWYVSVLGPEIKETPSNMGPAVGLDLGVVRLATLSDGTIIENPRPLAAASRKLRRRQKEISRKKKGSKNRSKARVVLARAYARVANVRSDAQHKATTLLAKSHGRICVEDLQVRNMTRRAHGKGRRAKAGLNRSVLDAGFGEFRRMLKYKAQLYGSEVVVVPAAYTSQTCSLCGCIDASNRKSQSDFLCVHCGYKANADLNAAVNILNAGSCPEFQNACGAGVRRGNPSVAAQSVMKQESAVA